MEVRTPDLFTIRVSVWCATEIQPNERDNLTGAWRSERPVIALEATVR